jgi:hypothetical protein
VVPGVPQAAAGYILPYPLSSANCEYRFGKLQIACQTGLWAGNGSGICVQYSPGPWPGWTVLLMLRIVDDSPTSPGLRLLSSLTPTDR